MTNADKIRSMDDEKLVDFIVSIISCWHCPTYQECEDAHNCDNLLLAWLKQEHKEHGKLTKQDKEAVQDLMAIKERHKEE